MVIRKPGFIADSSPWLIVRPLSLCDARAGLLPLYSAKAVQGMTGALIGKVTRVGRIAASQKSRRVALAFAATVALTLACVGDGG